MADSDTLQGIFTVLLYGSLFFAFIAGYRQGRAGI